MLGVLALGCIEKMILKEIWMMWRKTDIFKAHLDMFYVT